jgi:hypothetical protein
VSIKEIEKWFEEYTSTKVYGGLVCNCNAKYEEKCRRDA